MPKKRRTAARDSKPSNTQQALPSENGGRSHRKDKAEELWEEREKRLEELLEKEGENPEAKEDFNRLLRETVRQSSR